MQSEEFEQMLVQNRRLNEQNDLLQQQNHILKQQNAELLERISRLEATVYKSGTNYECTSESVDETSIESKASAQFL